MDRLGKALEKARELRDVVLSGPTVDTKDPPLPQAAEPRVLAEGARSKSVEIDAAELERHRIVARLTRNANADIFRTLRTKVMQKMARSGMKTIAITSANYGDGKSTIAINLALSIALDLKQTVLLVDLDLRNPSIQDFLGIESDIGLSDYLLNNTPVPQCLVKPEIDRFVVLPVNRSLENSSEMLGSPKMAVLANELKTRYSDRIVIYDMPPLLAQDDTLPSFRMWMASSWWSGTARRRSKMSSTACMSLKCQCDRYRHQQLRRKVLQ